MRTNTLNIGEKGEVQHGRLYRNLATLVEPLAPAASLLMLSNYYESQITSPYILLALSIFALIYPGQIRTGDNLLKLAIKIFSGWLFLASVVMLFLWSGHFMKDLDPDVLTIWLWVSPVSAMVGHISLRLGSPLINALEGPPDRIVVVGMNKQGAEVVRRLTTSKYANVDLLGFFDDRQRDRLEGVAGIPDLGSIQGVPEFVKSSGVNTLYLSLPMASQPRILSLLDSLRDTTVSIYFVPDMFVTDLIQASVSDLGGMPIVAVCESPYIGFDSFIKRASDVVISLLILILISPLMLVLAIAIKATSNGPIIFKQRRYGLDGREILIYKFRSMTVCEDGDQIKQAQRNDSRLTPIGGFLRKTSLDELPQFINVLQGRMSVIGPRPHAIAHNELYRKLIKGYMIRHKVKPGITGWAQVNGYRGETETLEKMQKRIEFDLEYLRNWSLRLDIYIFFKTIWVLIWNETAY